MKVLLLLVLLYFAGVNSQDVKSDDKCFVPVTCSGSGGQQHSTVEWRQITASKCEECTAPYTATSTSAFAISPSGRQRAPTTTSTTTSIPRTTSTTTSVPPTTSEPIVEHGTSAVGLADIAKVLDEQNATITKLMENIRLLEARQGFCAVKYNDKCFWVETNYTGIRWDQAAAICASRDGTPANIYSDEHHTMVMNYMRAQLLSGSDRFNVWLGMVLDISANTLWLFDGTLGPVLSWQETYPQFNAGWNCTGTVVRVPWDKSDQGLYNVPHADKLRQGVLCEK